MSYDALLLVSFGGPEKHEDVIPFLENVLRGRNVPRERMLEVAEHYYHFDGRSPINDQNRELSAAVACGREWTLVYQSRSGAPGQPWLGPDVCDYLREIRADVVIAPIGFLS